MTSLHQTIPVATDAATTWSAICAVGRVHDRLAAGFVTDTELDGDERVITFVNGVVARERIIGIDHERRRFAYSVIDSPLAMTHHHATFRVVADDGPGDGCTLEWDVDLLPDDAAPAMAAMMAAGAEAIAATVAGAATPTR